MRGRILVPFVAAASVAVGSPAYAADVTIADNEFQPKTITITVGSTVTWTHEGTRTHTVTADDGSFASGTLVRTNTYEQSFDDPGTVPYYCEFHGGEGGEGMSGRVVVRAKPQPGDGGDEGAEGDDESEPRASGGTLPRTGVAAGPVAAGLGLIGFGALLRRRP